MKNPPLNAGVQSRVGRVMEFLKSSIADFPNRIADPRPVLDRLPSAYAVLAALILAALVPRLIMSLLIPTLCCDGTTYIAAAESIEREGIHLNSGHRLNIYPVILALLHRSGLSWDIAGKTWGVVCSVLVVLPLFGWIRRQFNDRIAVFACLLYAAHPKLIEWAPELIREQTFWFLFTLGLYVSWRAITEVRLSFFFCTAIVFPAAVLTRFEGLFLYVALFLWTAARYRALQSNRSRLLIGLAVAIAAAPCMLIAIQLAWFQNFPLSQILYSAPIDRVAALIKNFIGCENPNVVAHHLDYFGVRPSPLSPATIEKTSQVIFRGLTPPFAILLLIGLVTQFRRTLQSDRLPAVVLAAMTMGAIWVHTWYAALGSSRYILTVAIISSGTAALGLLEFGTWLSYLATTATTPTWRRLAPPLLGSAMLIYGCCDAFTTSYRGRQDKAELGAWIRERCGENRVIYGADEQLDLIAYYAHSTCVRVPFNRDSAMIEREVVHVRPDIVVVSNPPLSVAACRTLSDAAAQLGMTRLDVPTTSERRPAVMTALQDPRTTTR
ncbi:MAG: glycosyltransferase family 39 protein [Planctomycetia bacterium]|nr:glycosyltransferase family 39 protein [Planctomycetia bacterium]